MEGGENLNSVAVFLQQVQPAKLTNTQMKSGLRGDVSSFHRILDENIVNVSEHENQELSSMKKEVALENLLQRINSGNDTENVANSATASLNNEVENQDVFILQPSSVFPDVEEEVSLSSELHGFPIVNPESGTSNTDVEEQLAFLLEQIEKLISKLDTDEDVRDASSKVLELLHQWKDLTRLQANLTSVTDRDTAGFTLLQQRQHVNKEQVNPNTLIAGVTAVNGEEMNELTAGNKQETRESKIWNYIFDSFQKREHFSGMQRYNADSNVTVKDIAKWLGSAIEKENLVVMTSQTNQAVPISKLEQHVIHINQLQPTQSPDQQLMDQFEKIMESTKLSALPNQRNHLTVLLRPDNMGELMVRFTQVNGEVLVKILVTTATAKEMLESNIHQLKNMFSPHQVVVEKQDANLPQTTNLQEEQENKQLKEQEQQQSNQSDHKDNQQTEDSFERQFEELLLNEKV